MNIKFSYKGVFLLLFGVMCKFTFRTFIQNAKSITNA